MPIFQGRIHPNLKSYGDTDFVRACSLVQTKNLVSHVRLKTPFGLDRRSSELQLINNAPTVLVPQTGCFLHDMTSAFARTVTFRNTQLECVQVKLNSYG